MNRRLLIKSRYFTVVIFLLLLLSTVAVLLSSESRPLEAVQQVTLNELPEIAEPHAHAHAHAPASGARRHILVIGDGMGAEQLKAASLYKTGKEEGLVLQSLPVRAKVATGSASHRITDSAAAGTAMATAVKVQNGVIGLRLPGDGGKLLTITEELKEKKGWAIGLVTTAFTTHATPAAFGAHIKSRTDYTDIAEDYLTGLRPDLILGGGGYGMEPGRVAEAGYSVVREGAGLIRHIERVPPGGKIAGLFGWGHLPYLYDGRSEEIPSLVDMAEAAVEFLAANEEGFFLMIEAARIDHAGHSNDIHRLIPEVLELDAVVEMLLNHPELQEETLLVVTADHETGGLSVASGKGKGRVPEVSWSTTGHTAAEVPLFATGTGSEALAEVMDNTQLRGTMIAALEPGVARERVTNVFTPVSAGEKEPSPH